MKQTKKGFTTVELVIVIAVIAILAAVLIPTFVSLIKKAEESAYLQEKTNQMILDMQEEVLNQNYITWQEFEDKLNDLLDAKLAVIGSGNLTEDQVKSIINAALENLNTGNNGLSKSQVEKIIKNALKDLDISGLTKEEVEQIIKDLLASWAPSGVIDVVPTAGQTLRDALLSAVQSAPDGATLRLPKGATVDLGGGGLYFLCNYTKNPGGTGKILTFDLNDGKIQSLTPHSNGYYYGGFVPTSGSLSFINGKIDIAGDVNGFDVEAGARLVLKDIELNVHEGNAIYPAGNASEVILENCKVVAGGDYGIATNNQQSNNIYIKLSNTTIEAGSCAVLVNIPCDLLISDSTVVGGGWGVFVRSGHAVIKNSTLKTTDGDIGTNDSRYNTSCEYFAYNQTTSNIPYWGQGPQAPYAPLIVGDYSSHNAYNHDTDCALTNVTFVNANSAKIPDVVIAARPAGKDVVLNYNNATAVSRLVVYGEGYVRTDVSGTAINHKFEHRGTITVNGTAKSYTGTVGTPDVYELVEYGSADRFTIPTSVGTFPGYQWFDISVLDSETLAAFKAHFASKGLNLTDAQWATVKFAAGGNANVIKSIKYIY